MKCPGCSGSLQEVTSKAGFVYTCRKCGGLVATNVYLGDSYSLVSPYMVAVEPPAEKIRYFDICGVSSKGEYRRHGWFDPETKRIVQVG